MTAVSVTTYITSICTTSSASAVIFSIRATIIAAASVIASIRPIIGTIIVLTSGYAAVEDIDTKEKKIIRVDKARVEALRDLLEEFPKNEPVVIFARFTKDLKNIHRVCKELGILSSEVSGKADTLKKWKEGETQVLAVQYTAGSESIDLTRARYCIYYSMTQRLALYGNK